MGSRFIFNLKFEYDETQIARLKLTIDAIRLLRFSQAVRDSKR